MPPLRLCYITDRLALAPAPLLDRIGEAIAAGADLVQIREKDLATRPLVDLVARAVDAARGTGTRVVVNDRLDVALALGADGVHLGQQSMPARAVCEALDKLGERLEERRFLVGVSCHSLEEARQAEGSGASYVLLGPIFETASKLRYGPPLGLEKLRDVTARVKVPVLALGGITVERVKPCLEAGATGVAGISLFQNAPSVAERVRELRAQFG
ncbi:MAG TPA: thiamine phosphate synthase [Terriglobia bacterium]|nr:thiamine phosphate synthase [Terriglobia bacterium]